MRPPASRLSPRRLLAFGRGLPGAWGHWEIVSGERSTARRLARRVGALARAGAGQRPEIPAPRRVDRAKVFGDLATLRVLRFFRLP